MFAVFIGSCVVLFGSFSEPWKNNCIKQWEKETGILTCDLLHCGQFLKVHGQC